MVTLPLSMPAILTGCVIIALPMFGDYYTPDLLSGSPQTSLIGNQINIYIHGQQVTVGAALVVVLMLLLSALLAYYVLLTARAHRRTGG
jgi:spermidine/putrescine transport system permease protein